MLNINTYWTSIIKRLVYFTIMAISILVVFKLAIFYMPFLIAFIISLMVEPAIKKIMEKLKITRKVSSIIVFIIVFGIIQGLLIWGISTIISESSNLLSNFNKYYDRINFQIQNLIKSIDLGKLNTSNQISQIFQDMTSSLLEKISVYIQSFLTHMYR